MYIHLARSGATLPILLLLLIKRFIAHSEDANGFVAGATCKGRSTVAASIHLANSVDRAVLCVTFKASVKLQFLTLLTLPYFDNAVATS